MTGTTLIPQLSGSDCVLAAIAMSRGCAAHSDIWTAEDVEYCVKNRGIGDIAPWMARAGYDEREWTRCYAHRDSGRLIARMLWKRSALLSVNSLNIADGTHMIFWDGDQIWDPHEGHYPEFLAFRHLSSCCISEAYLFDDKKQSRTP